MLIDGKVYIKDLGSDNGTFLNDVRIGRAGVPWTPMLLNNSTKLQLGSIRMMVNILAHQKQTTTDQARSTATQRPSKSIHFSFADADEIPFRNITLIENQKQTIGRAVVNDPPTPHNALIKTTGVSKKQAQIWMDRGKILIKPLPSSFPVIVNGNRMRTFAEIDSGTILKLVHTQHVEIEISFLPQHIPTDSLPTFVPYSSSASNMAIKNLLFDNTLTVKFGRETDDVASDTTNGIFAATATAISKQHAQFVFHNDQMFLVDKKIASGTFIKKKDEPYMRCPANTPVQVSLK